MLFFLSKKYFGSRNCLKEIVASIEQGKPLVLVQEQQEDKGGGPLELLKAECRDDEMREAIFDGRTPIAWHRISHFQNLTLKLIATEMLRNGPSFRGSLSKRLSAGNAPEDSPVLIQHGEVNGSKLTLPQRLVLWCSAGNPGAAEVAEELVTSMARNGAAIRVVDTMPDVQALKEKGESAVMLLYLNKDTWLEHGEMLERDVRAARKVQAGLKIVMVHENDKEKGGCEFVDFFGTTPQELIDDGIYRSARSLILECCPVVSMRPTNALCVSLVAVTLPLPSTRCLTAPSASRSWRKPWALPRERANFAKALNPSQKPRSVSSACPGFDQWPLSACPRAELEAARRCSRRWKSKCPAPKMACEGRAIATSAAKNVRYEVNNLKELGLWGNGGLLRRAFVARS